MNVRDDTFVIDLPEGGTRRKASKAASRRRADRRRLGEFSPGRLVVRIPGRRIRSQAALRRIYLEQRGTRRPALFVSRRARDLAPLAGVAHQEKGNLRLLLFEEISCARREFLQTLFRTVVAPGGAVRLLEPGELVEVLASVERDDLFIGGVVNAEEKVIVLYRGNFDRLAVPFAWFERDSTELPDFNDFEVTDHGQTVRLGDFEVATDALLYDYDPDYRARAKKRQIQLDDSLGGALRRLRILKGVSRSEFPSVSAREIARIERGEVEVPRRETLDAIAGRLGVKPEEIGTY
jgi:hypothetical protein